MRRLDANSTSLVDLVRRRILRPLGRLLGTDRWEPRVSACVHCIGCGHRFVLTLTEARFICEDGGAIQDAPCPACKRELLFWDIAGHDDE
jgi:hypothetical protein